MFEMSRRDVLTVQRLEELLRFGEMFYVEAGEEGSARESAEASEAGVALFRRHRPADRRQLREEREEAALLVHGQSNATQRPLSPFIPGATSDQHIRPTAKSRHSAKWILLHSQRKQRNGKRDKRTKLFQHLMNLNIDRCRKKMLL